LLTWLASLSLSFSYLFLSPIIPSITLSFLPNPPRWILYPWGVVVVVVVVDVEEEVVAA
jgi:hypothetical protein